MEGANGSCAVQGAEAGHTGAVVLLAPRFHPTACSATITWACMDQGSVQQVLGH